MAGEVDIGTLKGGAELDEGITAALDSIIDRLDALNAKSNDSGVSAGKMAAGWIEAEAALKAANQTIDLVAGEVEKLVEVGSRVGDVTTTFQHLTEEADLLGGDVLGRLREGTRGTVSDFELMQVVNRDLAAGLHLTEQQYGMLAQASFAFAKANAIDVTSALELVNRALVTGQTRGLSYLTGRIDIGLAERSFADALKTTSQHLTEEGRLEAIREVMLSRIGDGLVRIGDVQLSLLNRIQQASTAWTNFENELGKTVATSPVLILGFDGVRRILIETFGGNQQELIRKLNTLIEDGAILLVEWAEYGVTGAGHLANALLLILDTFRDVEQIINGAALAAAYLEKAQLLAASAGDIWGAHTKEINDDLAKNDDIIQHLLETMKRRGDAIQNDHDLETKITETTTKFSDSLEHLRQRMVDIQKREQDLATQHSELAQTQDHVTESVDRNSTSVRDNSKYVQATQSELARWRTAMLEISLVGDGWKSVLDSIDGSIVDAIKLYLQAGVSQQELATIYGLSAIQIKAVVSSLREENAELKAQETATVEVTKLWDQYFDLTARRSGSSTAKQIADIDRWAEDITVRMQKANADTTEFYDALAAVSAEKTLQASVNFDELKTHSKAYFQDLYDRALATYNFASAHADQFSQDFIFQLHDAVMKTQEDLLNWQNVADSSLKSADDAVNKLHKDWLGLDDAISRGFQYDLSSEQGIEQYKKLNPAAAIQWSDQQIMDFIKKGGTLQQLIDSGVINPYAGFINGNRPSGATSLPSFAEGGAGDFGSGTLAVLHGHEIVAPYDKAMAGFGGVRLAPGSIVIQYPIMNDLRAMTNLSEMLGKAFIQRIRGLGVHV